MKAIVGSVMIGLGILGLLASCAPSDPEGRGEAEGERNGANRQLGAQVEARTVQSINIDGSSTVYPLTQEMIDRLQFEQAKGEKADIQVNVSGTGGGFRQFCSGSTEINNASRPITLEEMAVCKNNGVRFIELPVAFDALTVVVHPDNDWVDEMAIADLKTLWEPAAAGKITTWSQLNPNWPSQPIVLYGPGQDSGTFDYFTEAVNGESGQSRTDYSASEDDLELVNGVIDNPNALAYFGYAYFKENQAKLKALAIDGGNGPVAPSPDAVRSNAYQPLSRPLFIYVNADAVQQNSELQAFVQYYLTQARSVATVVGYEPLPDAAYALALEHLQNQKTGTVFEGKSQMDLTLEALLEKEKSF